MQCHLRGGDSLYSKRVKEFTTFLSVFCDELVIRCHAVQGFARIAVEIRECQIYTFPLKAGQDSKHPAEFFRRTSLWEVNVLRWHLSKWAQILFEHPYPLSLSSLCPSSSFLMVEGLLPRSAAIFGRGHPRHTRNSIRFLSVIFI